MGKLGRLGLEPAQRYERERPGELIHIDVKKLGRIKGGAGKRVRDGLRQHYNAAGADAAGVDRNTVGWEYVHIAIDDATRLAYVEVLDRREGDHRRRVPAPRDQALRELRDHRRAADDRQRLALPLSHARDRLPDPRHPSPTNPSLPPSDQRQSRTLHPHHARRLGLRRDLPRQRRTQRRPRRLARTSTIAADHTAPSATSRPSLASTS